MIVSDTDSMTLTSGRTISIVTGANGYVGKQIAHEILRSQNEDEKENLLCCLVRPRRMASEEEYWKEQSTNSCKVCVMPYDMTDGGRTLQQVLENDALEKVKGPFRLHVYHVASVFGPTEDHRKTALENVKGTKDVASTLAEWYLKQEPSLLLDAPRLIITSSMAAVRATGQEPSNEQYYTHKDWNTLSELGLNWGSSYQWSKAESERAAWQECQRYNQEHSQDVVIMTSLCPSFIFGPIVDATSSYSIQLVEQWMDGVSPVQSRLCVDVRDVAKAHVSAAHSLKAKNERYVCTSEERIPSQEIAEALKRILLTQGVPEKVNAVHCDLDFKGGFIPIGQREVAAADRLKQDLGVICRPVAETMADMAQSILVARQKENKKENPLVP